MIFVINAAAPSELIEIAERRIEPADADGLLLLFFGKRAYGGDHTDKHSRRQKSCYYSFRNN